MEHRRHYGRAAAAATRAGCALALLGALAGCHRAEAQPPPSRPHPAQFFDAASTGLDSSLLRPTPRDASALEVGGAVIGDLDAGGLPDAARRRDAALVPAARDAGGDAASNGGARGDGGNGPARGGGPQRPVLGLPPEPPSGAAPPLLGGPERSPEPPIHMDDAGTVPMRR